MGQIEYILSTNSLVESQLLCDFNWAYKVYITGTCISPFVCGYHPYISSINSGAPNILLSSIFIKNDVTGEQIIVFEPRSPSPYLLFLHINKKMRKSNQANSGSDVHRSEGSSRDTGQ
jgi:hypothetical protein